MILIISKKERRYKWKQHINYLIGYVTQDFGRVRDYFSTKQHNKRNNMNINFILFKVYIEKYTNWSNLKVSKDKYETIIDFGKYRLYVS